MPTVKLEGNRGYIINELGASVITNTTTETNLFSTVIPAGKMGTSKILKFEIICHLTTPALSIPTLTLKLKLGTATLVLATTATLNASITDKPIFIEGKIMNLTTNSQFVAVKILNNSSGINLLSGLGAAYTATDNTFAIDTTVDQTFALTAQFGGLSATSSITAKLVEVNLT